MEVPANNGAVLFLHGECFIVWDRERVRHATRNGITTGGLTEGGPLGPPTFINKRARSRTTR